MVANSNSEANEYFRELIAWETEGDRTPAQPDIQIRADFPRKLFCLYVNGEAIGSSSQYKPLWHARNYLLGELA